MSGKRKSPTPDWLFGRSSKFKGIWIPREIPPTGIGPFPNTAWPTPFAHENDWKLVRDLFKAHELDLTDPIHWQKLILIFANEHRSRQPGAKKLWTEARLCQLAAVFELAQTANPARSDLDICKLLATGKFKPPAGHPEFPEFSIALTDLDWNRIRRVLPEARKHFAELIAALVQFVRKDFAPWTADHKKKVRDWTIKRIARGGHPSLIFLSLGKLHDSLR